MEESRQLQDAIGPSRTGNYTRDARTTHTEIFASCRRSGPDWRYRLAALPNYALSEQEPRPQYARITIDGAIPDDHRCVDLRQLQPGANAGC